MLAGVSPVAPYTSRTSIASSLDNHHYCADLLVRLWIMVKWLFGGEREICFAHKEKNSGSREEMNGINIYVRLLGRPLFPQGGEGRGRGRVARLKVSRRSKGEWKSGSGLLPGIRPGNTLDVSFVCQTKCGVVQDSVRSPVFRVSFTSYGPDRG